MVGGGQAVDPLAGGGEQDAVPGLAGADRDPGGQVCFAGSRRTEEHHVVLRGDEVQSAQVGDDVAFETASVVEVELLQRLPRRKPGSADASLTTVGLAGRYFPLQARRQELLVAPGLGAGPLGNPVDGFTQSGRLQGAGQKRQLGGEVATVGGLGGHHATGPSSPNRVS